MSLEGYGFILLTSIYMLMLLASVSVMLMLSSGTVIGLLTGILFGVLKLISSILMVECISKVPVYNGFNNLMVWISVNALYLQSFKYKFH